jgi:hypothetical protein
MQASVKDKREIVNIKEKQLQKPQQEKYKKIVKKFIQEYKQVCLKNTGIKL